MRNWLLGLVSVFALLWLIGAMNPAAQPHPQGDMLGMQRGETVQEYQRRVAGSIGEETAFALVTFDPALDAAEAARVVDGAERVSAVVVKQKAPIVVPEPAAGATRAEVFARVADGPITSVVVRADGAALRAMAAEQAVFAVEALPPDAVWGAFGIAEVMI